MCTPLGSAPRPRCTPQSQIFGWAQHPALASPLLSACPLFLCFFNQKGLGCSMQHGPCPSIAKSKSAAVRGHHPAADTVLSPKIALHYLPGILQAKSSVCKCVHVCGFVHACIYFCACVHLFLCMRFFVSICPHRYFCLYSCPCAHFCASVHFFPMHVYVCLHGCLCACILCTCACVRHSYFWCIRVYFMSLQVHFCACMYGDFFCTHPHPFSTTHHCSRTA